MSLVLKILVPSCWYVNVQPVYWSALHILLEILLCSQVTSGDYLNYVCILIHNDQGT
jgi:hypothetical protein